MNAPIEAAEIILGAITKTVDGCIQAAHELQAKLAEAERDRDTYAASLNSLRELVEGFDSAAMKVYADEKYRWTAYEALSHLVEDAARWKARIDEIEAAANSGAKMNTELGLQRGTGESQN